MTPAHPCPYTVYDLKTLYFVRLKIGQKIRNTFYLFHVESQIHFRQQKTLLGVKVHPKIHFQEKKVI